MQIKSDKEDTTPGFFSKVWNTITDNIVATLLYLIMPVILYSWYSIFPVDWHWLMLVSAGIVFGVGLITDGKLFKHAKDMAIIFYVALSIITVVWYVTMAVETEEDRMDLKPFITKVTASKDNSSFNIDNKLPFESNIVVSFNALHQYDALFSSKEHFNEFNITAVKSCSVWRLKSLSCDVEIEITHKDSAEILYSAVLYNSVYPKKLQIEMGK